MAVQINHMLKLFLCIIISGSFVGAYAAENSGDLRSRLEKAKSRSQRIILCEKLAQCYRDEQQDAKFIETAKMFVDLQPGKKKTYKALVDIGETLLKNGELSASIEAFSRAVALLPGRDSARLKLAAAYEKSDLYELSRRLYLDIIEDNPRSYEANFNLGRLLYREGFYTQAMEHYRRCLILRPAREIYFSMAECAKSKGDTKLAIDMMLQAVSLGEGFDGILKLGSYYALAGKHKQAEETLSRAISLEPGRIEPYMRLGLLYLENGRLDEAGKMFSIASEKDRNAVAPRFFLSYVYYRQNKLQAARREINKAGLDIDGENLSRCITVIKNKLYPPVLEK